MSENLETVAYHYEQSDSNRCVPACICMVLSRQERTDAKGKPFEEDDVCAALSGGGHGYAFDVQAARMVGGDYLAFDPDDLVKYDRIYLWLRQSHWVVALLFAEKLAQIVQAMSPPPVSRFGGIWHGKPGALHAVVLTGADAGRFQYLDPYYPASGQPFSLSREDFVAAFTGYLIDVPLR